MFPPVHTTGDEPVQVIVYVSWVTGLETLIDPCPRLEAYSRTTFCAKGQLVSGPTETVRPQLLIAPEGSAGAFSFEVS